MRNLGSASWFASASNKVQKIVMLDLFGAAEAFLRQPSGWLAILLIIVVVWLIRVVTDLRTELTEVKHSGAHYITSEFLSEFSTKCNRKQLVRIRNAARRATKDVTADPRAVLQRFEQEIQAEINTLEASFGPDSGVKGSSESETDDPDSSLSSEQGDPQENHENQDYQDVKPASIHSRTTHYNTSEYSMVEK